MLEDWFYQVFTSFEKDVRVDIHINIYIYSSTLLRVLSLHCFFFFDRNGEEGVWKEGNTGFPVSKSAYKITRSMGQTMV